MMYKKCALKNAGASCKFFGGGEEVKTTCSGQHFFYIS